MNRKLRRSAASLLALACILTNAHAADAPLQATLSVPMPAANGQTRTAFAKLDGGNARVRARVINRADDRTVTVRLRFRYTIPPDTIALDEILDEILVETRDGEDNPIGTVTMDPHEVNVNPNGPRIGYDLTLYRPEGSYETRVTVHGNYE